MTAKLAIPVVLGLVGASAVTATALTTNAFSSPKKCWYDGEKDGSFWEEVEKILEKNHPDKDNSKLKNFIGTLCTMDPKNSLAEFQRKFDVEQYSDVFDLLIEKWLKLEKPENLEQDEELELETVL